MNPLTNQKIWLFEVSMNPFNPENLLLKSTNLLDRAPNEVSNYEPVHNPKPMLLKNTKYSTQKASRTSIMSLISYKKLRNLKTC